MAVNTTKSFTYTARDAQGTVQTGKMTGETTSAVAAKLRAGGLSPVEVKAAGGGMQKEISLPGMTTRVKMKDLSIMCRQFATMVSSGLSLMRSLTILAEQTENKELGRILTIVRSDIEVGTALSSAMAKHVKVFPPLMINMIRAGEVGGFLEATLIQLAESYEAEVKLRGKVKAALTYPVMVFIIAIIAVIGMLVFIVPIFSKMFAELGGELPLPTRILVIASHGVKYVLPVALVVIIALYFAWPTLKNKPEVRNVLDPLKLKMPIFGPLVRKIAISRFSRNLGVMLRSGVPILQSLEIVADTSGNVVISRAVADVMNSVRGGESLTKPLAQHAVFPPMVVQMLTVGEDTGALDTMLAKISDFYDQEVEATTESLTALIEPLMIAFLGIIVGAMIVALYLPIFKLSDLVQ